MIGSYGASLVIRAIGTWAIFQGVMIILGGPLRWANPAYNTANLMPGSPYTWGVLIVLGGALIMYGSLTNRYLPLKNFTYQQPTFTSVNGKFGLHSKSVIVNWSSEQIRNTGLRIVGCWLFLFGIALMSTIFYIPDISYATGSRDILLSLICMIMTKVKEPK